MPTTRSTRKRSLTSIHHHLFKAFLINNLGHMTDNNILAECY